MNNPFNLCVADEGFILTPEQIELHEILRQYPTSGDLARLNHEILLNLMTGDEVDANEVLLDSNRLL